MTHFDDTFNNYSTYIVAGLILSSHFLQAPSVYILYCRTCILIKLSENYLY